MRVTFRGFHVAPAFSSAQKKRISSSSLHYLGKGQGDVVWSRNLLGSAIAHCARWVLRARDSLIPSRLKLRGTAEQLLKANTLLFSLFIKLRVAKNITPAFKRRTQNQIWRKGGILMLVLRFLLVTDCK